MSEPEYFPEVSNWYRRDTEYGSDTTDIWINEEMGIKMRLRVVSGPFTFTTAYVVEKRAYPSDNPVSVDWSPVEDPPYDSKGEAEKAAHDYAVDNNEPTDD